MEEWQLETLENRIERGERLEFIAKHLERRLKRVNGLIELTNKSGHLMDIYQSTKCALLDLRKKLESKVA